VTRDGVELDRFLEHAPGSPRNPLDDDWLLAKFRANAELALESAAAERLASALLAIDEAPAVGPVLALSQIHADRLTAS
jgi:hypothetical protein